MVLACSIFAWTAGPITVDVVNSPMDIKISAGGKTLAEVTGIQFGTVNYTSIVSSTQTSDSIKINLSASQTLIINNVATGGIHFSGTSAGANSVQITMKYQNDHFFGITEQNINGNSPDLQGRTINVTAANIENYGNEPNAKVWSSFYISSLGYGSFFNSFAEGTYAFGVGGLTTITHSINSIDWYIYYGPTGDKIHQGYFKTIQTLENLGTRSPTKRVPVWACGLVIWHDNFSGSQQVISYATNSIANHIPITGIWIDRPYSDGSNGWANMNFSAAFSNPAPPIWIKQISSDTGYNSKLITWIAPCTFGTPLPPAGTYFSGGYDYLDLTNPAAVAWYEQKIDSLQEKIGIQGHKMDRCEESFSQVLSNSWYDGTPTAEKQGKYLYLNAKVTDETLRKVWGDDQFNFPRGAYNRCQPYINAIWAGDTRAPWAGLVGALANGIKTAFCGFPVWGSDIGGYGTGATKIPTDQFLRWLTFGCFCGFMENMLDGKEPWTYTAAGDAVDGASFVSRYADIASLRLSLIPYTYSLANTSTDNGVLMRPLPYMYPDDANTYAIGDEYLFGNAFLVAPITSSAMTRSVYLPAGTWYNFFNTTEAHTSGTFTTASVPLYQIPVYIKANSVYVTGQVYPGISKRWVSNFDNTRNVTINVFPGNAGENAGFTYVDYLAQDAQKAISLSVTAGTPNIVRVQSPSMTVPGKVSVHLNAAPTMVYLNSVLLQGSQYTYTAATQNLDVSFAAGQSIDLLINGTPTKIKYMVEPALFHGNIRVVISGREVGLLLPPITGLNVRNNLDVRIFDVQGRNIWQGQIRADQNFTTDSKFDIGRIGRGSYIVSVKTGGILLQRNKVIIP
jgi:alpha-glucosidase (family GH31 glycosyl hydrolase)